MTVLIARCPIHGLHGERTECFVCGGPVDQVLMAEVDESARAAIRTILNFAASHPLTGLAEAPVPVIQALTYLSLSIRRAPEPPPRFEDRG